MYWLLVLFSVNAVVGGFLIAGARKMRRLEAYEFSVLTSLMTVLQLASPVWPFSLAVGGWAFWILRKPEVKAAFALRLRQAPAPPPEPPVVDQAAVELARARLNGPRVGLMVTAIINWAGQLLAIPFLIYGVVMYGEASPGGVKFFFTLCGLLFTLSSIIASGFLFYAALKMKRLESRRLALLAAILALLVPPALPIGWPVGLWALAVLTEPEVKAAFARRNSS
jgi:hypothetical protein